MHIYCRFTSYANMCMHVGLGLKGFSTATGIITVHHIVLFHPLHEIIKESKRGYCSCVLRGVEYDSCMHFYFHYVAFLIVHLTHTLSAAVDTNLVYD